MARIKIKDIPRSVSISAKEMRSALGGGGQITFLCETSVGVPGPIPIPYPNIDTPTGTITKISGEPMPTIGDFEGSTGDESGTL